MVDRLSDDANSKALELVAKMDPSELKNGVYTERLPHFIELMEKYGLDYRNPEHCSIVGRSIEARLELDRTQIIQQPKQENLEKISDETSFKKLFFSECNRVNNRLISIYKTFVYNPDKNSAGFYYNRSYDADLMSPLFSLFDRMSIKLQICEEKLKIKWNWKKRRGYPLYNISIGYEDPDLIISAWSDFAYNVRGVYIDKMIEQVYDYYFQNDRIQQKDLNAFKFGFKIFRDLPERVENALCMGKAKGLKAGIKEENKRRKQQRRYDSQISRILKKKEALTSSLVKTITGKR